MKKPSTSHLILAGVSLFSLVTTTASAQTLFSESFDTDTSANWAVNNATVNPGGNAAVFAFDYSTVGIPSAPNSGGTTRGLKLTANISGGIQTGLSVSPLGLDLSGDYRLTYHSWQNFNGPAPAGGSGSTQVTGAGIGTAGTSAQWAAGVYDSVFFGATGDGGSSVDYRVYPKANTASPASGFYAAGTSASPDSRNNADPYYAGFGGAVPPLDQTALFPQQTGSTAPGALGFAWREVEIEKIGNNITWSIDGLRIATVDASGITLGGGNILLNHFDINNTSSADPNAQALTFGLFDNVVVTQVPEPSTVAFFSLAGLGLVLRRFARRK